MIKEKEIWADINSVYKVSNFGNVKSLDHYDSIGRLRKGKILKQFDNGNGYKNVGLSKIGRVYVHRLVCIYFLNNGKETDLHVNHIDGDKSNNNLENLELISRSKNDLHKVRVLQKNPHYILDLETGIFYVNSSELYESLGFLNKKWKRNTWKEFIGGRRCQTNTYLKNRFLR